MRFVLVGAPGTNKGKISRSLSRSLGLFVHSGMTIPDGIAVGTLADYRVEIKLAVDRAFAMQAVGVPTIYEHTLIDSLAYASLRFMDMRDLNNVDEYTQEKWATVTAIVGAMVRDTFRYDHVFVIEGGDDDLQKALVVALDAFGVSYSMLSGKYKENLASIKYVIETYLGSGTNTP